MKAFVLNHQHKITWIGMPLLCVAVWALGITSVYALWH